MPQILFQPTPVAPVQQPAALFNVVEPTVPVPAPEPVVEPEQPVAVAPAPAVVQEQPQQIFVAQVIIPTSLSIEFYIQWVAVLMSSRFEGQSSSCRNHSLITEHSLARPRRG